ncbi:methylosome subunit pICln-like [Argiope bruennichi]|uniref:Methylosome subunit pICln n=1 Tax=Argiope bruennichi TaxID=94029 RepID=A0A8T0E715_ARGBR|nr:methylosome subunit pICln-like [Argiope bruennichi]XP_055937367.1 methylosome subunit pICln-like [Argiope bruennichi]XP_055937368.1 methylosome subunit pICln-like [Argiope bruennichi]KAF8767076.1 Methylosome subunit pICln like protein [Argiope bruennichi]
MVLLKNFPAPTEKVHHTEHNTTAFFENECLGKGTLYISESVLCWLSNDGEGFSLKYQAICFHAVSRDLSKFPHQCLYMMLEKGINIGTEQDEEEAELTGAIGSLQVGETDDEEDVGKELRFVPDNTQILNTMFRAMLDCQALNPVSGQNDDDDDDDGVFMAPSFNINVANGALEDFENEEEEEESDECMDNQEQFEDAEF